MAQNSADPRPLITRPVDEAQRATLAPSTRPEANPKNDRGRVADDFKLDHMMLLLRRSPEREAALAKLIDELHDPASPNYHQWLSAKDFGALYGANEKDISAVSDWLGSRGFRVEQVYPSRMVIDFSGTAGQLRQALRAEIHRLEVNRERHYANYGDPQVPAALAPAIVGIASINDFKPHPMHTIACSKPTTIATCYDVVPADLATIYNLNPLFTAGITGKGQTIYVIGATNVVKSDWIQFRAKFGLAKYRAGTLATINPGNCAKPGPSTDPENTIDVEWASAAAPSATIVLATCQVTSGSDLVTINIQNLISLPNPPAIVTLSYGECEPFLAPTTNQMISTIYQQAVAEGVSIFVSAGDQAAANCDDSNKINAAVSGIAVNGLASTSNNVAVGGTDFADTVDGVNNTYWSATDGKNLSSAKSYIPEIPWNNGCASTLLANYFTGSIVTYGTSGFCNSPTAASKNLVDFRAGSGGPSSCATAVGGTCQGYGKPIWQQGIFGNPTDGVRDLPDVSLFSADPRPGDKGSVWEHSYIYCVNATCAQGSTATAYGGGTSFATPIMAGIQALVGQKTGQLRWGNPNYVYYVLAKTEFGPGGNSSCFSTGGVSSSCIFYDVISGDIDAPCTGNVDCYRPSGTYGVLSTDPNNYAPAFFAGAGWDFATGIGSVNVANLVNNWPMRKR